MNLYLVKSIFITFLLATSTMAKSATHYHLWHGLKKPDFPINYYLREFSHFIQDIMQHFQTDEHKQFMISIPPANAPDFIPNHFVMITSGNKDVSERIHFINNNWNSFNRNELKPLIFKNYFQDNISTLQNNHVYDLFGTNLDWSKGHTMFFIGVRNSDLDQVTYLKKLKLHIELVTKSLKKHGLQGFIIIANTNYTVAYLNWKSTMSMGLAYNTPEGKSVLESSKSIHTTLMYEAAKADSAGNLRSNSFLFTY